MQGFISWLCSWPKFVSNGTRVSKKAVAPIEKRLILSFMVVFLGRQVVSDECDGPVYL